MTLDEAVSYAERGRGERRRPPAGWDSLTPTEIDVVRLAAQGLSNPQIAERLFISRHTAKVHLSHVFAKLGLSSRAELAAEATRRGL
jgi:DNA-binding CsgD family transcriptional regulator